LKLPTPQIQPSLVQPTVSPKPVGVIQIGNPIMTPALSAAITLPQTNITPQEQVVKISESVSELRPKVNVGYGGLSVTDKAAVIASIDVNRLNVKGKGGYKVAELKDFAKKLGLQSKDKKSELIQTLINAINSQK
jgi:hypothetical protein